jgi:hypothetical protein
MAKLGENHRRRILATFQHIDKLLSQSLHAIAQTHSQLQAYHIQDISSSQLLYIQNLFELIRLQMGSFLKRLEIVLPERSKPASWIVKTNLTSIGIALEDLSPSKMRGYGDMDAAAAHELARTLQEIRKLLNQLQKPLE